MARGRPRLYPDMVCEVCEQPFRPTKGNANRFCSLRCASAGTGHQDWFVLEVRRWWDTGLSARLIAKEIEPLLPGATKNTVIGIAHRNDFPARVSPIIREEVT